MAAKYNVSLITKPTPNELRVFFDVYINLTSKNRDSYPEMIRQTAAFKQLLLPWTNNSQVYVTLNLSNLLSSYFRKLYSLPRNLLREYREYRAAKNMARSLITAFNRHETKSKQL
jgi:hypothetical protein